MATATKAINWLTAPLGWIERARGRRRAALVVAAILLVVGVVGFVAWANSLRGLPDIGDPFDADAFGAIEVPDAQNALLLYRIAVKERVAPTSEQVEAINALKTIDWAQAGPEVRAWLEANRPALATWKRGTERPDAQVMPASRYSFSTLIEPTQELREFARLGTLEASRLRSEGDLAGAWSYLRAVLRSSRHAVQHGHVIQRLVGSALLQVADGEVAAWAADPRVDSELLRAALADVDEVRAMSPPPSDTLKVEYLATINSLNDPRLTGDVHDLIEDEQYNWTMHLPGAFRARVIVLREPERSRRVARLFFANWLEYCDEPLGRRPPYAPLKDESPMLYQARPGASDQARAISPNAWYEWRQSTLHARLFLPDLPQLQGAIDRDLRLLDSLPITLANELYRRDHGGADAPTYRFLVEQGYLPALPAAYADVGDE